MVLHTHLKMAKTREDGRLGGGAQSGNRFRFRLRCVRVRACEAVCGREANVSFVSRASEPKFVGLRAGPGRRALPGGRAVKKKVSFFRDFFFP